MSNRGGIDSQIVSYLEADHQILFFAVKAEFDTETIKIWTGDFDLVVNGETYLGVGTLLSISNIEDTLELKSSNISVVLAGMDSTVLNLALTENYQNRSITIFLGYLSGGSDTTVGTMTLFKGRMQSIIINDNPNGSTITVDAENRLIDLARPSNLRYTKESQQFIDSTDTCFNRIQSLQDKEIIWGRSSTNASSGTTTGNGSCFVAGTKITMSDMTYKNIEDIESYDEILTYDLTDNKIKKSHVVRLHKTESLHTVKIKAKEKIIHTTPCHPIYSVNKGWVSVNPNLTKKIHNIETKSLICGDILLSDNDKKIIVQGIEEHLHKVSIPTYNLIEVYKYNNYFANNILVHNKINDEISDTKIR